MPTAELADRGVVRVHGEDARQLLDGLFTCDMDKVRPDAPRFGALLSPQGKILFDFIVVEAPAEDGGGFYLDTLRVFAPDLVKRLNFYKLRAKVAIEDLSETLGVVAGWNEAPKPDEETGLVVDDPRLPALGWRAIVARNPASPRLRGEAESRMRPGEGLGDIPSELTRAPHPSPLPASGERVTSMGEDYHLHRVVLGVPEAGKDFLLTEAFPHEALMDQLNGVDFDKGCYVGQEVVSRMQHRGTARTRIVPLVYLEGFNAEAGVEVTAGGRTIGKTGSGAKGRGLAMLRLDRAADALASGETILAGGMPVRLERPSFIGFPFPGDEAPSAA